ncbi:non-ribosomal peptide synthetase [Vibrio nigripulchritudo]|uniref:non-ribosomal peptide synthetase n=4 Tax=Vibrio nigripulchritudo TaxID=28173 RepID=UPI0003B1E661|nr:non-ribosomal peptide synthetase [Vibrio nigripulchritudo]CCN80391.1 putative ANTIBIOTIC SYNTHETASE fused with CoA-dependent acyltransferase and Methyltransferase [Vibrio nigripulchritudo BLFn1]CCN92600.1 putative ANTIBIOTIC SYNTHETASE fused with CoA-dependent acyltransferase and Methyltransferase [Vibrio nigripulchritudo ENn2]CCO41004.1 putative ANTIBIOTIC SYNTHETASE fused with CoA-dependent acyltransferase and Methyltransferase [Vibrio nigripulchritudo SFn135]CCO50549.1 putative ANTIBIOTIC
MSGERKGRLSLSQEQRKKLLAKRKLKPTSGISKVSRETNTLPVTELQQDMWVLESLNESVSTSNIPCMYRVENFDANAVREAMDKVVQRHESLRTVFRNQEGKLKQCVLPEVHYAIDQSVELSDPNDLNHVIQQFIAEPFDLHNGPLFRIHAIQGEDTKVIFVFSHLIFDGGSIANFERDFFHHYHCGSNETVLPELPIQQGDYAHWLQQEAQQSRRSEHLEYWKQQLNQCDVSLSLPFDRMPGIQADTEVRQWEHVLPTSLTQWLKQRCTEQGVSLYSTLLSAYSVLLHRITGQSDLAIASALTNRSRPELRELVGLFAGEALLRVQPDPHQTFWEVAQTVQKTVFDAIEHSDISLGQINRELNITQDSQDGQVARTLFLLREHRSHLGEQYQAEGWSPYGEERLGNDQNRYDLSLICRDESDSIRVAFNYKPALFDESTITRFGEIFEHILQCQMSSSSSIDLLPLLDLSRLLADSERWNQTQKPYQSSKTLHAMFEAQVEKTPDNIALIFGEHSLTYRQLNQRANQLARFLQESYLNRNRQSLSPNTPIALYLDRSLDMVVGILAVMKSGGAYVPIATDNPVKRTRYIFEDTKAQFVLTQQTWEKSVLETIEGLGTECICIDSVETYAKQPVENLDTQITSRDMAYIIYTSGTTGQPKGVMVPHTGVVNRIEALQSQYPLSEQDRVLQKTPYTFDVSVWELLWANWTGAAIVMSAPKAHQSPELILETIRHHSVTLVHFVPPMLTGLSHYLQHANLSLPSSVKRVFCSGDALTPEHIRLFNAINQHGASLHNQYGPTEASIEVSYYDCQLNETDTVPIGQAIQNVQLWVMDPHSEQLQLCPDGLPGELYIGGVAVTDGYLNREVLTQERFVDNPFASQQDIQTGRNKLYKTGDLVRRRENGDLEYLGRNDFQVKVRGYRIELEEIESALQAHPSIQNACVHTVEKSGEKKLVGYYTEKAAQVSDGSLEEDGVAIWKSVYEAEYKSDNQAIDQFDIRGWKSSFTQTPIPAEEMREWVDATVSRIANLRPRRVLEIGSGSGLIYYPLHRQCEHYIATDFSENAIKRLSHAASVLGYERNSEFVSCPADQIALSLEGQSIDTIVMNSVSQYFPSQQYLDKVLKQAIEGMGDKGQLFLGDIRDLRLLEAFHLAILSHRSPDKPARQLVKQAKWLASKETELAIAPAYFLALSNQFDCVQSVEILPKRGHAEHEMNRFRFDVIIKVDKTSSTSSKSELTSFRSVTYTPDFQLDDLLQQKEPQYEDLWVSGYPDQRVCSVLANLNARPVSLKSIVSIEALHNQAKRHGYTLKVLHANEANQAGKLHLFFSRRGNVNITNLDLGIDISRENLTNTPNIASKSLTFGELSEYLSQRLPAYMVPAAFVPMKAFPLSSAGKLDRNALPEPEFVDQNNYVAPDNEQELALCQIWKQVLGVESIGVNDNFFRIGGDSIIAIQLVSKLRQAGFSVQVKDMFDCPTVRQLSERLSEAAPATQFIAEQGTLEGECTLLPIQQWFFDKKLENPHHWNQAFMLTVPSGLDHQTLENAVHKLAKQHDILRARFNLSESKPEQIYHKEVTLAPLDRLNAMSMTQDAIRDLLTRWQSDFDLSQGPLWRAAYIEGYSNGEARLWFAFHHLIIDAVSWRILADDLQALVNGRTLGDKTSSYRQWADAVALYPESHPAEQEYWNRVVADYLPEDYAQTPQHKAELSLSEQETHQLVHSANQGYQTEINDLLLTALSHAMTETFEQPVHHITLEGHGREPIDESLDISRTVGWFTTAYPVRLRTHSELSNTLISTKEMLRAIPEKGIGYGAFAPMLVSHSLPDVYFNYLGQLDSSGQTALWTVTDDDAGEVIGRQNQDSARLNINGGVFNGQLKFEVLSQLPQNQTASFVESFKAALKRVLALCEQTTKAGGIKTASDFQCPNLHQPQLEAIQSGISGFARLEDIYPASSLQQGFVYHHISRPDDDAYRLQVLVDYERHIDHSLYLQAWELTAQQYPALRLAFHWDGEIVQVISDKANVSERFTLHDFSGVSESEHDMRIDDLQAQERRKPFDLSKTGLFRVALVKRAERQYTLIQTAHHSVTDGWSNPILLKTVHQYYDALVQGLEASIKKDTVYDRVQAHKVAQHSTSQRYWQEKAENLQTANDLSVLLSGPADLDETRSLQEPAELTHRLEGERFASLKSACQSLGVTTNVALQFAWHKLIQMMTQDSQTIVGTTVSGRDIPIDGIEESVGLYINTLPLAVTWEESSTIAEVLRSIHRSIAELNSFSSMSLADLQKDGKRLFHNLFIFENYPSFADDNALGLAADTVPRSWSDKMDYPFSIMAYEKEGALSIQLGFDKTLLDERLAARLLEQLESILLAVAVDSQQLHEQITVISEQEARCLINDWNQTEAELPVEPTWYRLFEAQAQQTPDAVALVYQEEVLTYHALNEKSNQLANTLRDTHQQRYQSELKPDTPVALFMERSSEMLIAILAVLKAGGAYVPVSPEYPKERAQFIFEDTAAPLVLTQQSQLSELDSWLNELSALPELVAVDSPSAYEGQPTDNLDLSISGNDLAYVIYTSGTTGKPKGVMMPHSAYADFIHQYHQSLGAKPVSLVSLTQYTFDIFGLEYGLPLLSGGTVYLSDIHQAPDTLSSHALKTNVLQLTPSVWSVLQVALPESVDLSHITVIVGGESGSEALYQSLSQRFQKVIQVYGPTEACIWSTQSEYQSGKANLIGTPLNNESCYVLSTQGKLCPIGVPGELHISGVGLARGYLNREALTQERFITSPIARHEERLYKTGDLVRWRHDGQLEYIGRNDFQVKIRGYRIELGEIEAVLQEDAPVKQAVVIDREKEGEKYLAAYIVSDTTLDVERIRQTLSASLPDFMVPSTFTQIDAIPLTMNGKLDRRALPEPEWSASDNYTAPETELEIALCGIWQEVLGAERVGIHDSFFQVGGNSINAIKVVSQINRYLGHSLRLELVNLYTTKTIGELAQFIEENQKHSFLEEQDNEMSI